MRPDRAVCSRATIATVVRVPLVRTTRSRAPLRTLTDRLDVTRSRTSPTRLFARSSSTS